ncbi:hypothetical protein ELI15_14290 [Rhizobium ruizarguesonis]|uniref:hypothetical protein n=1 Tax=Rhizobium ruizarguesonis TaxID=2081791 RepID=UPI0010326D56|nr:hypothetical protein [Rhizobium ruizarguesonis]TAW65459.1 hypothetical protein ELI15_14290 [Rhizobium ruizarguesonis]
MSNIFTSRDPAGAVVGQTGAIFAVLAAGAVNAHMSGLAAARAARESNNSHVLRHQLIQTINYAESIMQVAESQAAEIERLKSENNRLRTAARTSYESARRLAQRAA